MPTNQLLDRALDAIPGYRDATTARQRLLEHAEDLARRARGPEGAGATRALANDLATTATDGKKLPDDLHVQAFDAAQAGERLKAGATALRLAAAEVNHRADELIEEHVDFALDVLRAELDELLTAARAAAANLGDARTAEQAVDAGPDAAAALRAIRESAARYRTLRKAHADLIHLAVVGSVPEREGGRPVPRWGRKPGSDLGWWPKEAAAAFPVAGPPVDLPDDDTALMFRVLQLDGVDIADPVTVETRAQTDHDASKPAPVRPNQVITVRPHQDPYKPQIAPDELHPGQGRSKATPARVAAIVNADRNSKGLRRRTGTEW
ncbi:hypothetical protein GCM10010472_52150 [Pseudonocardia halophobica]|uniref:Uncharacterized protein n=1 Tax=Pseudonocardia halophobica TaxID=29401 RepID=A0A9W6NW87_9PSEU|nr:hypothetical protein [Pseudonocardia halophobica]GLL11351.1 hypothetical protein GCM10017577_24920 [Pseudonocardia halophobica]